MNRFSRFFDTLFLELALFSLAFVWLLYLLKSSLLACIFAAAATALFSLLFFFLSKKKRLSARLKKEERQLKKKCLNKLLLSSHKELLDFFLRLMRVKHKDAQLAENGITVPYGEFQLYLVPAIGLAPLSKQQVLQSYLDAKKLGCKKLNILCLHSDPETERFATSLSQVTVTVLDGNSIFTLMKKNCLFPEVEDDFRENRSAISDIARYAFHRKRAKSYFLTGALLLFSGIFTPYLIYYAVAASLLFCCTVFCLVNVRFNKAPLPEFDLLAD